LFYLIRGVNVIMKKQKLIADLSLLAVALIWGSTFVIVQNAIAFLEPFTFNGVRFTIASLILLIILITFNREQLRQCDLKLFSSGVFIGFWLFVGYATQTVGLLYTSSSKAGFITGLSVVLVPVFSFAILKIKPTKNAVLGVSVATVGLYLLTMTDRVLLNIGDGLVFICAIAFALQIIFTGKYSSSYPSLLLTVIQISTVAVLSLGFSILFEDWKVTINTTIMFDTTVLTALLITSLLATAFAFFIQTSVQKYTTPTRVALIFATEPVFAAITGFIWAHDRLSFSAITGCLFIFAGMIFAEMPTQKGYLYTKKSNQKTLDKEKIG
jgi:drug/metabolite transporter (DMT)-like permease